MPKTNTKIIIEVNVQLEDMYAAEIVAQTILRSGKENCAEDREWGKSVIEIEHTQTKRL